MTEADAWYPEYSLPDPETCPHDEVVVPGVVLPSMMRSLGEISPVLEMPVHTFVKERREYGKLDWELWRLTWRTKAGAFRTLYPYEHWYFGEISEQVVRIAREKLTDLSSPRHINDFAEVPVTIADLDTDVQFRACYVTHMIYGWREVQCQ